METSLVDNAESTLSTDVPDFERKVDDLAGKDKQEPSGESEGQAVSDSTDGASTETGLLSGEKELKRVESEDEVDGLVGSGSGQGGEGEADQPEKVSEVSAPEASAPESASEVPDAPTGTDQGEASGIVRAVTPGSRTSTPPPGTQLTAPKKFSAVNVTKKFLSKTGQPAASPASASKLGINGECQRK